MVVFTFAGEILRQIGLQKRNLGSVVRKKRRFSGNEHTKKTDLREIDAPTQDKMSEKSEESSSDEDGGEEHCDEHVEAASFKCLPASVRKMDTKSSNSCEESTEEE